MIPIDSTSFFSDTKSNDPDICRETPGIRKQGVYIRESNVKNSSYIYTEKEPNRKSRNKVKTAVRLKKKKSLYDCTNFSRKDICYLSILSLNLIIAPRRNIIAL